MADAKQDYRTLSAELDAIVDALQREDIDVDQAMQQYERGLVLIGQLETYLKTAENKITKLGKSAKA